MPPVVNKGWAGHYNVGKMVIYRTCGTNVGGNKPAVILAQSGNVVDLAVFTYDYGTVGQLGAILLDEEPKNGAVENTCWLI